MLSTEKIKLWIKWGSKFESKLPLVKAIYTFDGEFNPKDFINLLLIDRGSWDDNLIEHKIVETISPEISVIHYGVKAPFFFMKAKDFAEKAIHFERDGVYYGYHGCVSENVLPLIEKYQRCETIFSGNCLRKQGDYYSYCTFSQMNLNVLLFLIKDWNIVINNSCILHSKYHKIFLSKNYKGNRIKKK